jgi:hypothetical protein
MKITIFNQKGGVSKTMLATQIALYFDLKIVDQPVWNFEVFNAKKNYQTWFKR